MWYVYILECRNKALYTGVTNNTERRLKDHQTGKGGHYTSYNRPKKILYTEEFKDKSKAKSREQQIKRWSKSKKLVACYSCNDGYDFFNFIRASSVVNRQSTFASLALLFSAHAFASFSNLFISPIRSAKH